MRVFITGMGMVSAFGKSWEEIRAKFELGQNAVRYMRQWDRYADLNTRLAAPIDGYRKQLRSLGIVSMYSVEAAGLALRDAGLMRGENLDAASLDPSVQEGRLGVACGSSTGSTESILAMAKLLERGENECNANTYIKMMPHTTAANIALFYSLKGRIIPTSSACTSGSHAIGYAYESIKSGKIDMMLAGGAEELCPSEAYVFDMLYAAKNSSPEISPAPFDEGRDGLVLGEGAGILLLESEESAVKRGAKIYAEVVGFGSNCDGSHVTRPQSATMKGAMALALKDANLTPEKIGYVNAHATATKQGDIAESIATNELFGDKIAISSLKSYLGHTLGACGGLEAIFSVMMMREKRFFPTINLTRIDPSCAPLFYLTEQTAIDTDFVMSNNFAFGGVNTSLIFKKI